MHSVPRVAAKSALLAVGLAMLCGPAPAAEGCSVAGVVVDGWIRIARTRSPALPTTTAIRRELAFEADDAVVLNGYSYAPPPDSEAPAKDFVLLLQGSASSAAQLAETASRLALAAKREVFVYEYRGYARGSTVRPTAAAIQRDVDGIIDRLSVPGGRGVVIGFSMGGIFAIQSLSRAKAGDLRALVDSVPARVPTIPLLLRCPRSIDPLDAATADLAPRLGVLYGVDDGWSKDPAAHALMAKVGAGGGRVWSIGGGHVDLSDAGLAVRLPIYVEFVQARSP